MLFIGNNFEEWFMRLIIRVLCDTPFKSLKPKRVYIINDSTASVKYEEYFIRKYSIEVVHKHPVKDFVESLMSRVLSDTAFKDRYVGKQVFISYDRDNRELAEGLYLKLRRGGINTWFDIRSLEIGEYETEIRNKINAVSTQLFICLISRTLLNKTATESYVKRVEWPIVEQRIEANKMFSQMGRQMEKFFVLPIAVDDFNAYENKLPDFIKVNNVYDYYSEEIMNDIDHLLTQ